MAPVLYSTGMLSVGIGHLFLPIFGYKHPIVEQLAPVLANHFYYLATYALCAFFMTQGGLPLWLARRPASIVARQVAVVLMFWWWGRLILEIRYPVETPTFGVGKPTIILFPIIILAAAGYTIAVFAGSPGVKQTNVAGPLC